MRRCRGTPWEPIAYFFGIPLIVLPIFFTFVFGDFAHGAAALFSGFAIIRLLEKNLPIPAWTKAPRGPYMVLNRRGTLGSPNPG
jgi:vacuolar-type H+-ATPase subunit I/STV1